MNTTPSSERDGLVTRHYLNDAYQYGLDTGEFNPDLANVALGEIDTRLKAAIADHDEARKKQVLEAIGPDELGGYERGVKPIRNNLRADIRAKVESIYGSKEA